MNEISTNQAFRFGEFTLDPARAALFRGEEELRLRQRTFEVLTYLVRNSGRVVSKQELFENIWGDVAVTDDSLVQCLVEIRRALGDDQDRIKTVRGRGYPFEGPVSTLRYLQTELGRAVAQQIRLRLSARQDQALVRRQARNPQAYEHYLRGRVLSAKPTRAALFAAIDEYKQATALDPEYALAYAGLPRPIRCCRSPRTCRRWSGARPRARPIFAVDAHGCLPELEKAYAVRDANLVFLPVAPQLDRFHADPRFQALLDRCGFTRKR